MTEWERIEKIGYNARYDGALHRECPYSGFASEPWKSGWRKANIEIKAKSKAQHHAYGTFFPGR